MPPLLVRVVTAFLAIIAAVPAGAAAPAKNPRLASLQIEIWPEYDRPQNLVILKGELAAEATLPAVVTVRIPVSAGAPSAVAYADASGKLLNLGYERDHDGRFVLLRLTMLQRSFHVEFYEPLVARQAEREYRYAWPGDFAVDRLGVLLKEPALAKNVSASPDLGTTGAGPDGLKYRAGDFGPLKPGEPWVIAVGYTKSDPRTSAEILGAPAAADVRREEPRQLWLLVTVAGGCALAGGLVFVWWRRRARAQLRSAGAAFCRKCGRAAPPADRFCAGCGAALK